MLIFRETNPVIVFDGMKNENRIAQCAFAYTFHLMVLMFQTLRTYN